MFYTLLAASCSLPRQLGGPETINSRFDNKTKTIKYIMLEIFPSADEEKNKEITIIDDTHIFDSRNGLIMTKKDVNNGVVELYCDDEDDKYLSSIYYISW